MDEFKRLLKDAKGEIVCLMNFMEHYNLEIIDFTEVYNDLIYLQGYADCLKEYGFVKF